MSLALPTLRSGALVGALAATLLLTAPPPPAQAHPFGPPQTASITVTGADTVQVRWRFGGTDDISYLAVALDVLPADRVTLDGAVFYEDGDDALVAAAPAFHRYVLQHITILNQGLACVGEVEPLSRLADDGATVNYRCPGPLGNAAVSLDMLNDLHPAYRTLATGPDGQRAVYNGESAVHDWVLGTATGGSAPATSGSSAPAGTAVPGATAGSGKPAAVPASEVAALGPADPVAAGTDLGRGAAVQLAAVGGGLAVIAGVTIWLRTRKRRI
ncbi:hypothetical protein D1871_23520 [Nakamurella silvestris]|nr:hypothetical protein D1871_23520 [Nakamurella silvestris]